MATFDEFYDSLDPDQGIRGYQFEKIFVPWFLKTDPTWSSQIKEIWLWQNYPRRWRDKECGIDLVYEDNYGKDWAVQSKCISPDNDIKKSEIDSFLSESNDSQFEGRLLIASTDGIGINAQQVINRQEKQVVCFLLEHFRQSEIEFPTSINDLKKGKRKKKKTPDPRHQIEAIEKVSEGLKSADRGQVLMACGTGKTLTSLWIKEKIKATQVLVLVPSLSLLSQTLNEWNTHANEPFKWICVCSDKSVAKDKFEDSWISNTSEIGVPVTSEPLEVKHFLDESGSKVVFATYQSAKLIVEAQEHHDTSDFDLIIADEAHRCAGKRVSNTFGCVLDENKLKASKRLFLTATPKIISEKKGDESIDDKFEITSMDDNNLFGKVFYQLTFSQAIKKDLLSDYEVVVIGIDDKTINQKIKNRDLLLIEGNKDKNKLINAETCASQIAITKAIKNYDLNRIITFHNSIKNAKNFSQSFLDVIQCIDKSEMPNGAISCDYISGKMRIKERKFKLNELRSKTGNFKRLLSNARCLGEGVDIPDLNGIAFIDPKQSQIDIIQSIGRVLRKSDHKEKGIILIPLYISEEQYLDEEILLKNFKKVWKIVFALKSQDDFLMESIDHLRIKIGEDTIVNFDEDIFHKFNFELPERINQTFSKSIRTLLVENSSESWFERYGELKRIYLKEGHSSPSTDSLLGNWIVLQRKKYKNNLLIDNKIQLLNEIEFIWDINEKQWNDNYLKLKEFYMIEGHSSPPRDSLLGEWCITQRQRKKKGKVTKERIDLLNKIEFIWDIKEKQWNDNYLKLKEFYMIEGHSSPPTDSLLGSFCRSQRKCKKQVQSNKKFDNKRIQLLDELEFVWDAQENLWMESYRKLIAFSKRKNSNMISSEDRNIIKWYRHQESLINQNKLFQKRKNLLEKVKFKWDMLDQQWNDKYLLLKEYFEREGHSSVPLAEGSLGRWCNTQRRTYKQGKLKRERIDLLEKVKFKWTFKSSLKNN